MYIIYCSNIKHESMTLIVPIMILQAKATDRRAQAEVATKGDIRHMYDNFVCSKDDI